MKISASRNWMWKRRPGLSRQDLHVRMGQGFAMDKIILENPASSVQGSHNEIKILSCPVIRTQLLVTDCYYIFSL